MEFLNIIVTGTGNSGKTTFIETLSDIAPINLSDAFSAKDSRSKVELGRVQVSDTTFLYLISTPPQERFHVYWDRASNDLVGFIFVISDKKDSIEETKKAIATLEEVNSVPFLVVANGIDDKKKSLDQLRKELQLEKDRELLAIDVRKKADTEKVINALLSKSLETGKQKTA